MGGIYMDTAEWYGMLDKRGCKEIPGSSFSGKTCGYSVWETPWGTSFMVPTHVTPEEARKIIARDIDGTRPPVQ